jgi:hypothetical protein
MYLFCMAPYTLMYAIYEDLTVLAPPTLVYVNFNQHDEDLLVGHIPMTVTVDHLKVKERTRSPRKELHNSSPPWHPL